MRIIPFLSCFFLQAALMVPCLLAQTVTTSDLKDRTRMQLSIYNSNVGLIKETRKIALPQGEGELRLVDVASRIVPGSVYASFLKHPNDFSVLEQTYQNDPMDAKRLLDKYVGRQIKIVTWNETHDRRDEVEATLLSNAGDQILGIRGEIYLGHPGTRVLPGLPEGLVTKPTLVWKYAKRKTEPLELEISYLTTDMSWHADYVMLIDSAETSAQLSGWAAIDNRSGAEYPDAELKLVAGAVHRVEGEREGMRMLASDAAVAKAPPPQFQEGSLFEYNTYDLQRRSTLKNNESKQIHFMDSGSVLLKKEYLVYGTRMPASRRPMEQPLSQPVSVSFLFRNSREGGLGSPLPAGVVRLYKADGKGDRQFIGEDRIKHAPVDEEVALKLGQTSEVTAERNQSDFRQLSSNLYESEWEITLKNHKEQEVGVGLIEPLSGNWKILSNSQPFKKVDAFTIRFDTKVPAKGELKVKYRVQVGL